MFASDTKAIQINSTTPGAQVIVDGQPMGYTPAELRLDAHRDHSIVIRGRNGEAGCRLVASVGVGCVILDILAGVIPLVIDIATGEWASISAVPCYGDV